MHCILTFTERRVPLPIGGLGDYPTFRRGPVGHQ